MSYFETRPVVVDVDADVEVQGQVFASDERGTVVRLLVRERLPMGEKPVELHIQAAHWRQFARVIAAQLREVENG